jgi:hypothetical protein
MERTGTQLAAYWISMLCRALCRAGWLALLAVAPGCLDLDLDQEEVESSEQAIVRGRATTDFPTTGMLLIGGTADVGTINCSVTLIDCDKVLTAAHCVCEDFGPGCRGTVPALPYHVYFQHAGFFRVQKVEVHPDFSAAPAHDLALLTLVSPVTGIRPTPLASEPAEVGTPSIIAGFGRVGGDVFEYGIKRRGDVTTAACNEGQGDGKLCWLFDGSPDSSESNVCHGDSGGSTFVERGGVFELAGVHSTTNQLTCLEEPATLPSTDTSVFDHLSWLRSRLTRLPASTCGDVHQVGDEGAVSAARSGLLDLGDDVDSVIDVPPGTAELRVAMNSSDGVAANFDFYLMAGAPAGPGRYDCSAAATGPHGSCIVESPPPGPWHIDVMAGTYRATRGGEYQLVSTLLTGAPIGHGDRYVVEGNRPFVIGPSAGVLLNDEEGERPGLVAELDQPPRYGKIDLAPSGSFVYLPAEDFVGRDWFHYRASDGTHSGGATVELEVRPGSPIPDPDSPPSSAGCAAGRGAGGWFLGLLVALAALVSRSGLLWRR